MKIAQIAPPWFSIPPKNYGGTELLIHNLVEAQVAQGHDVTLFAPQDAKTSAKLVSFFTTSLVEEGMPWNVHFKAYYHLYKSLERARDFDIVHTHLSSASDLYIFPLTATLATPHITTLESSFPFDRVSNQVGEADRLFMEWASTVPMVTLSQAAQASVPYDLNFCGYVHPGLSLRDYPFENREREEFFIWMGRFVPEKGAHLAIEAAKRAKVPLILSGPVDQHVPEALTYFKQGIEPQIDNKEVMYVGPSDMQQKVYLFSRARGLLNPIQWEEPFGMVMIEAMALGCPVIAFARGAAPEIVFHNKTGFLVHTLEEIIHYIAKIDQINPPATREYVEEHFSARRMAEKYVRIYENIIAES